jgi:hydroxymethylbilane synthase
VLEPRTVRTGSRASALARVQTEQVAGQLRAAWPHLRVEHTTFSTRADARPDVPLPLLGAKGLFTEELEAALRGRAIDLAVHSLKDLPTDAPAGLAIGAVPRRADPADVLVSRSGRGLEALPRGATVGTGSRRRAAQLLHLRPDLRVVDIRGNVERRIRLALGPDAACDAVVLAHAGLARLGRLDVVSQVLPLEQMLPAPAQGALGVQCRDEAEWHRLLAPLHDLAAATASLAERAFLARLGGGCAVPISAYAEVRGDRLHLRGRVSATDGSAQIDVQASAPLDGSRGTPAATAERVGAEAAAAALARGAAAYLEAACSP